MMDQESPKLKVAARNYMWCYGDNFDLVISKTTFSFTVILDFFVKTLQVLQRLRSNI